MITRLLHNLCVYFVRLVKSIEFFILKNIVPGWTQRYVTHIMAQAGVTINGDKPWDVHVHHKDFYPMVLNTFTAGVGDSYARGMWDCEDIQELAYRFTKNRLDRYYLNYYNRFLEYITLHLFNIMNKKKVWEAADHYDTDNELFEIMLGKETMLYTCAYWQHAKNLDQAQTDKMDRIAKKLRLKPGMRVLDIGCGWGGLARHLTKNYGVSVVGVTISEEQAAYAKKICKDLPFEVIIQDYRDIRAEGQYDRIVCVEMFEHVGPPNYNTFFNIVRKCLNETGMIYLQTMGLCSHDFVCIDPFLHKYMFPNGVLGTAKQVTTGFDGKFVLEDWQCIGNDYMKTIQAWHKNIEDNREKLESTGRFDDEFFRLWKWFLLECAGAYQSRMVQLWQIVLSKNGVEGGYYAAY